MVHNQNLYRKTECAVWLDQLLRGKRKYLLYENFSRKPVIMYDAVLLDASKLGMVILYPSKALSSSSEAAQSKSETLKLHGHMGRLPVSRGQRAHVSGWDEYGYMCRRHWLGGWPVCHVS